ncbi:MAG: hypothetical protein JW795_03720 [Chitinivibrionales bacterium]|nr:hypothetical protein [Chitinivibrionales bacterium]
MVILKEGENMKRDPQPPLTKDQPMSHNKNERQNRIKQLLMNAVISSQEECTRLLQEEGITVTQATLSRDFAELGVIRIMTEQGLRYVLDPNESGKLISQLIGFEILLIQHNESVVLVRTLAGRASGVAHYIDRLNKKEILGTVAGDDTVLVIPDSVSHIDKVVEIVKEIMNNGISPQELERTSESGG